MQQALVEGVISACFIMIFIMQEFYFANYRLLADETINEYASMEYLDAFKNKMPYTHTFILHIGEQDKTAEKYAEAVKCPLMCEIDKLSVHDGGDSWAILRNMDEDAQKYNINSIAVCTKDYGDITMYMSGKTYWSEYLNKWNKMPFPFSTFVRIFCEAGMVIRNGLPLHASLVEKDGQGIVFLGPSGMGKSTQAKLWTKYKDADFIIGDRPGLRCIDGVWYGFGMPWDGKDNIRNQRKVPIKALISLEQAKENRIIKLNEQQAMIVLLNQAMMPMWDDRSMDKATVLMERLIKNIPFYHLKNLADRDAVELTYRTIFE